MNSPWLLLCPLLAITTICRCTLTHSRHILTITLCNLVTSEYNFFAKDWQWLLKKRRIYYLQSRSAMSKNWSFFTYSNSKFGNWLQSANYVPGYGNLLNQSIVRFERIMSGRFSPLTALLPFRSTTRCLHDTPLLFRSTICFKPRSCSLMFTHVRSAPFSASLRSHAMPHCKRKQRELIALVDRITFQNRS